MPPAARRHPRRQQRGGPAQSRQRHAHLYRPDYQQHAYYYYAVITQTDGDKIWTAPIRYTRNDAALAQTAPAPAALSFQAVLQGEEKAVLRWTLEP